jgi:hypothetical protein
MQKQELIDELEQLARRCTKDFIHVRYVLTALASVLYDDRQDELAEYVSRFSEELLSRDGDPRLLSKAYETSKAAEASADQAAADEAATPDEVPSADSETADAAEAASPEAPDASIAADEATEAQPEVAVSKPDQR